VLRLYSRVWVVVESTFGMISSTSTPSVRGGSGAGPLGRVSGAGPWWPDRGEQAPSSAGRQTGARERGRPMEQWQMDVVWWHSPGGDEGKVASAIDDSRLVVSARVVARQRCVAGPR
jgi:hypothetical protein